MTVPPSSLDLPRLAEIQSLLKKLIHLLPETPLAPDNFSAVASKKLRAEIGVVLERLHPLRVGLDPIAQPSFVFDPSRRWVGSSPLRHWSRSERRAPRARGR